jgi:hypothetical protein
MSVPLDFVDAGSGEAVDFDGKVLSARAPRAFAPGMPLQMIACPSSDSPLRLQGKSIGSRRSAEGPFEVRIRLVNLRRADRERLESLLG